MYIRMYIHMYTGRLTDLYASLVFTLVSVRYCSKLHTYVNMTMTFVSKTLVSCNNTRAYRVAKYTDEQYTTTY